MPLTHQPFAAAPAIDRLSRTLHINVGPTERTVSVFAGAALVSFGLAQRGVARWGLLLLGGSLLGRGVSGHCALYHEMGIDTRHDAGTPGVRSGAGVKIEREVEIHCPAAELYTFWRRLDQLPRVLRHVESVEPIDGQRSHWVVRGPLAQEFEWDAEIINDHENELIAWQSLSGAAVRNAGSVRFEALGANLTRVRVSFEFEPPAGALGLRVSELLGDAPARQLEEDLVTFKDFAERELTPASGSAN